MSKGKSEEGGITRLSFIKTATGVAAGMGAAAIGVPGARLLPRADRKRPFRPIRSTPTPQEPVIAYVRDAERGEVTVVSGTTETTYRDPALVKRLLGRGAGGRDRERRWSRCHRTVKHPRSARTRSPTTPTSTRSSAPTSRTRSRSSANFVPLQDPPGGPNFFEFGDDVLYSIYIDNDGDGEPEISYEFRFKTTAARPATRSSTTPGQITSLDSPNWNKRQFYSVTRVDGP